MRIIKKITVAVLFSLMIFTTVFTVTACGLFKDNSKIYIVSEDAFKDAVKTNDNGEVKKLDRDKLEKADLEDLVTGQKYYAVLYADGKKISQGWFNFYSDVTVNTEEVYSGTKKGYSLDTGVSYPSASSPTVSGLAHTTINVAPSEIKKTDYYIAVGFTPNNADKESFYMSFQFYEGSHNRDFNTNKKILYNKQITALPSVKYLNYEDYMSGSYDDKLKDSMEVALGQRCYAVIDYTLSEFKEIEETDVAEVVISVSSKNGAEFTLQVEEFPTADYSKTDTDAKARFKPRDGAKKRFIISITAQKAGIIDISAEISGEKMSILSSPKVSSSFTVNPELAVESKLEFILSPDRTYYIVSGRGQETSDVIVIPTAYKGLPVKEIADEAFINTTHIKELKLSEGLVKIGARAFKSCNALESVVIPLSVTSVGDEAFADCENIGIYCKAESRPNGWSESWADGGAYVTWSYGDGLFTLNTDKSSYTFSYKGVNGTKVSVPATYNNLPVTEIAASAFSDATDLEKIKIPGSVTKIGNYAFDNCLRLKEIKVTDSNENYKSVNGDLYSKDGEYLIKYAVGKANTDFTVPSGVKRISANAFAGCSALTNVSFTDSVTIYSGAFKNCTGLKKLDLFWEYGLGFYVRIGDEAFSGCTGLTEVDLTDAESIGVGAFSGCTELQSVKIGSDISIISENAFYGCSKLQSVVIPSSVTEICKGAFGECTAGLVINYKSNREAFDQITKHNGWNTYYSEGEYKTIRYSVSTIE